MSLGRIAAGVATGGQSELWRAGAKVAGGLLGGGGTQEQVALETPEQKAARAKLMNFAETGKFGDFTAGAEVPLGYGDYGMTGMEGQGLSALQQLLQGGIPSQYALGDKALAGFLTTNPADISAQFDPFRDQVMRQTAAAEGAVKRGAGFAGNLYSTDTIRKLGDVNARGNETLTSELARLTNEAANRRLQAVPLAYQSAESQQGAKLQQVAASQQYGDLTRRLNDQAIKVRDAEILRRRAELQLPIQAAQTVAGMQTQFGVPSVSTPSPYQGLLETAGSLAGQYVGNKMFLNQYSALTRPGTVPGAPTAVSTPAVSRAPSSRASSASSYGGLIQF